MWALKGRARQTTETERQRQRSLAEGSVWSVRAHSLVNGCRLAMFLERGGRGRGRGKRNEEREDIGRRNLQSDAFSSLFSTDGPRSHLLHYLAWAELSPFSTHARRSEPHKGKWKERESTRGKGASPRKGANVTPTPLAGLLGFSGLLTEKK